MDNYFKKSNIIMIDYLIYHYCMDNFNDIGFGCSYRNIQTIISSYKKNYKNNIKIPNIKNILNYFDRNYQIKIAEGKTIDLWIEPFQISEYLKNHYKIKGENILYVTKDEDISKILKTDISVYLSNTIYNKSTFDKLLDLINQHFNKSKLPIVIDNGTYSYCIVNSNNNLEDLILIDPHTTNSKNTTKIKNKNFLKNSFWMFYLPIEY